MNVRGEGPPEYEVDDNKLPVLGEKEAPKLLPVIATEYGGVPPLISKSNGFCMGCSTTRCISPGRVFVKIASGGAFSHTIKKDNFIVCIFGEESVASILKEISALVVYGVPVKFPVVKSRFNPPGREGIFAT